MMIDQILEEDILNCHNVFEDDKQLKDLEEELYAIMAKFPEEIIFDMEQTVNAYGNKINSNCIFAGT